MYLRNRIWEIACWAVACHLGLLLFIALPLHAENASMPEAIPKEHKGFSDSEKPKGTLAKACYYKKRLNNKRTSSGAIHSPRKMTAAHPTLPLGTRVKVVNLANKRSVVVTVNDRCRKHGFEFIDLSQAAARKLGFLGKGVAMVRILPIEEY